eukprot:1014909-Pelagomonas_calceolata.AAC.1
MHAVGMGAMWLHLKAEQPSYPTEGSIPTSSIDKTHRKDSLYYWPDVVTLNRDVVDVTEGARVLLFKFQDISAAVAGEDHRKRHQTP